MPVPGTQEWYAQVVEEVLDPEQLIFDPHHHLWPDNGEIRYRLRALKSDIHSGHRVEHTVFVECRASYYDSGPSHLRSVGETEFVSQTSSADPEALIAAMVAHVNLSDRQNVGDALDAHQAIAGKLVRGIRHSAAWDPNSGSLRVPGRAIEHLYLDANYLAGVIQLGERSLVFEAWHFHHQNREFLALARKAPGTIMVLDHFGTPLGVGPYAAAREEIFEQWKRDISDIAGCHNVFAKLGGLAMPDVGFGFESAERPPTSDEFVAQQRQYYEHVIECFTPARCMFESNFPVDRLSISYPVLWNAFKKISAQYTQNERDDMFFGTASRVYKIPIGSSIQSFRDLGATSDFPLM